MIETLEARLTLHAIEFDLIEAFRPRLPRARFGKGSIKVTSATWTPNLCCASSSTR